MKTCPALIFHLLKNDIHHLKIDLIDQSAVFQDRNKLCRRKHASLRIDPSCKCFLVTDLHICSSDDGLVKSLDPVFIDGLLKMIDHILAAEFHFQHFLIKESVIGIVVVLIQITGVLCPVAGK